MRVWCLLWGAGRDDRAADCVGRVAAAGAQETLERVQLAAGR